LNCITQPDNYGLGKYRKGSSGSEWLSRVVFDGRKMKNAKLFVKR